ncbi:MAG TPA: response regulator [Verrucomicrobiae bacterium]|nr:response regulator [Verrucomicrobiae bacterium]
MSASLQILLIEDSEIDAELIARTLKSARLAFRLTRIESEPELRHALEAQQPDVILSDHGLPSFDGFKALAIVRASRPELPFIFVSGSNDQQMVMDMFDRGATDYVFKHDIHDLGPAVRHALEPQPEDIPAPESLPHPELELGLPAASPPLPVYAPPIGHLRYCPWCHRTHGVDGRWVGLETYLADHVETSILREICAACLSAQSK